MKRAFNYTNRKKIPAGVVTVSISEGEPGSIPTFEASFAGLNKLGLDPAHQVILEPYVVSTSMRFDCGAVGQPQLPQDRRLTDLDQGGSIRFRVLVVDPVADPSRIVAAGKVSASDPDDQNVRSILRLVETPSLGERLWRLDLDDEALPELLINSTVPGFKAKLQKDPLVQGLVLPAVVRELLTKVLDGDTDDTGWTGAWKKHAEGLAGRPVPPGDEEVEEFIQECVVGFCNQYRFADRYITLMKGNEDD
jgi:hypothetical protein